MIPSNIDLSSDKAFGSNIKSRAVFVNHNVAANTFSAKDKGLEMYDSIPAFEAIEKPESFYSMKDGYGVCDRCGTKFVQKPWLYHGESTICEKCDSELNNSFRKDGTVDFLEVKSMGGNATMNLVLYGIREGYI